MATLARRATRSETDWACVVGVGGRQHSARSARHVTGSDCVCGPPLAPIQQVQSIRARTENSPASVNTIPPLPAKAYEGSLLLRIIDLEPGSVLMFVS